MTWTQWDCVSRCPSQCPMEIYTPWIHRSLSPSMTTVRAAVRNPVLFMSHDEDVPLMLIRPVPLPFKLIFCSSFFSLFVSFCPFLSVYLSVYWSLNDMSMYRSVNMLHNILVNMSSPLCNISSMLNDSKLYHLSIIALFVSWHVECFCLMNNRHLT